MRLYKNPRIVLLEIINFRSFEKKGYLSMDAKKQLHLRYILHEDEKIDWRQYKESHNTYIIQEYGYWSLTNEISSIHSLFNTFKKLGYFADADSITQEKIVFSQVVWRAEGNEKSIPSKCWEGKSELLLLIICGVLEFCTWLLELCKI
jgi:hypothetical protein